MERHTTPHGDRLRPDIPPEIKEPPKMPEIGNLEAPGGTAMQDIRPLTVQDVKSL